MLCKTKSNYWCFAGCLISFNAINTSACCLWRLVYIQMGDFSYSISFATLALLLLLLDDDILAGSVFSISPCLWFVSLPFIMEVGQMTDWGENISAEFTWIRS